MECTLAPATLATATPLTVGPPTLLDAFATVPEPRRQARIDYPLPAILALAVAAILANHCSVLAIAARARRRGTAPSRRSALSAGARPASRRCNASSPNSTAQP